MGLPDERELIETLTRELTSQANRAGFASDCAVIELGGTELVATVDGFADRTHFPTGLPPRSGGLLAGRAALSDLAAAGAEVIGILVALGVPEDAETGELVAFSDGITDTVRAVGGEVLGGDTKPREQLTATLTALGSCPTGQAMTRTAARPGDKLVVTGPLGGAGAALARIREGLAPARADPLIPPSRIDAGIALREQGIECAMDLSDGLADAAVAIGQASGVEVVVDAEAVPLHPWALGAEAGLDHALTTGGDYELCAAVPDPRLDAVRDALAGLEAEPTVVGRVEEGSGAVLETAQGGTPLTRGYEHEYA